LKLFASPPAFVVTTLLLAAGSHPALGLAERWPLLVPAAAFLWLTCLASRAGRGRSWQVLALGAAVTLAGLAYDSVRGVSGTLDLAPGEAATRFTESGPDRAPLGLRPFDFNVRLDSVDPDGAARLSAVGPDGATSATQVAPRRATSVGGFRLGHRGFRSAPETGQLHLSVAVGGVTREVDVASGVSAHVGDLEIGLERYFPDFALDANRQPFSRSEEPRNPGALLHVKRGSQEFRVFVLQALPGIHKQQGLDASFSLTGVEAGRVLRLDVSSTPAAAWIGAGALLVLAGMLLGLRKGPALSSTSVGALGALGLVAILAQADAGRVLRWSFGAGPARLPGVGLILGMALLAGLAALLLLGLASLVRRAPRAEPAGRSLLLLAATLSALGTAVAFGRAGVSRSLAAVAVASALAMLAAIAQLWPRGWGGRVFAALADLSSPALAIAALAAGGLAWHTAGTYDTPGVRAAAAAALLGMAAREPVALARLAVASFIGAVSWLLVS
jgi:hypothetical protein